MEILLILFAWPFLLLAAGLVFVGLADTFSSGSTSGHPFMMTLFMVAVLVASISLFGSQRKSGQEPPEAAEAKMLKMKGDVYLFSIALLFPMFIRYVVEALGKDLVAVIAGIVISFVSIVMGMGVKRNRVLSHSSIAGGTIAMIYLYSILWSLGEGARIVAAAVGLVLAVTIAAIKFKAKPA